jgi:hypothetical protein
MISSLATLALAFMAFTASAQEDGTIFFSSANAGEGCEVTDGGFSLSIFVGGQSSCAISDCIILLFGAVEYKITDLQGVTDCFGYDSNQGGCTMDGDVPIAYQVSLRSVEGLSGVCRILDLQPTWVICTRNC